MARLSRRIRALRRLLALDSPALWRYTAHGAVLVLTACVFVISRSPQVAAEAADETTEHELSHLAARVGAQARAFLVPPARDTDAEPTDGRGGIREPDVPGFISPGPIPEADQSLLPWDEPYSYIVKAGDTITDIAAEFGLEPETLLYANPDLRENPHNLSIGDEIVILPVNGVLHVVEEGETLEAVAERYETAVEDIVAYEPNQVALGAELAAGTELVVPGGQMEIEIPSYAQMVYGSSGPARSTWAPSGNAGPAVGTGSFHLATYGRITQWYSRWHAAADIANSTGTPIYAVDGGTVTTAGWYGALGNVVIIDHGNGYQSLYAHMNSFDVAGSQTVQRGQVIGTVGCTRGYGGRCTGPHLHLEITYQGRRVDPCAVGACP